MDADDLARFLQAHTLDAEVLRLATPTPTVERAAAALGTTPAHIVKTLLFLVDGRPVLAIAAGLQRIDARRIAAHFGVGRKRVRLADADTVQALTGYPIGALPPFGHRRPLAALLDPGVLALAPAYAGGGARDAMLRVAPVDILRLSGAELVELAGTPAAEV